MIDLLSLFRKKRLLGSPEEDYPTDYSEAENYQSEEEDPFGFIRNRERPALENYKSQIQRAVDYKKPSFGARLKSALIPGYDVDKNPDNPKSEEFRQKMGLLAKLAESESDEGKEGIDLASRFGTFRHQKNTERHHDRTFNSMEEERRSQRENRDRDDLRLSEKDKQDQLNFDKTFDERQRSSKARESLIRDRMNRPKTPKNPSIASQLGADKQVIMEIQRDPKLQVFAPFFDDKGNLKTANGLTEEFARDPSLRKQYQNLLSLIADKKRKKLAGEDTYSPQGNQFDNSDSIPIEQLFETNSDPSDRDPR